MGRNQILYTLGNYLIGRGCLHAFVGETLNDINKNIFETSLSDAEVSKVIELLFKE